MKDGSSDESSAELIPQPGDMPCVPAVRRGRRIDLDRDYVATRHLDKQVGLVSSLFVAQMVEARAQMAELRPGSDLRNHERINEPPEQIAISQDCSFIDEASRVHAKCLEVPAKQHRVSDAVQGLGVASHHLIHVRIEPEMPRRSNQVQGGLREAASQRKFDVATKIRWVGGSGKQVQIGRLKPIDQSQAVAAPDDLGLSQAEHLQLDDSADARPCAVAAPRPRAPGQQESTWTDVLVDRTPHCPHELRNLLPLVEKHRQGHRPECCVWVKSGTPRPRPTHPA